MRVSQNKVFISFILASVSILQTSCIQTNLIKHNQIKAANVAERAAFILFVEQDSAKWLGSIARQDELTSARLDAIVSQMHKNGEFPTSISGVAYEKMPGQEAMKIFLEGRNEEAVFRYVFVMIGTEPKGYLVGEMYRLDSDFPTSSLTSPL